MRYILITFTMSLGHTSGVASAQVVSPVHYISGLLPKPFELFPIVSICTTHIISSLACLEVRYYIDIFSIMMLQTYCCFLLKKWLPIVRWRLNNQSTDSTAWTGVVMVFNYYSWYCVNKTNTYAKKSIIKLLISRKWRRQTKTIVASFILSNTTRIPSYEAVITCWLISYNYFLYTGN